MNIKVLHISTKDNGGAAIAGIRLHKGLLRQDIDSNFLFKEKQTNDVPQSHYVTAKEKTLKSQLLSRFGLQKSIQEKNKEKLKSLPHNYEFFSFPESGIDITQLDIYQEADIINLHWIPRFLDYPSFFRKCTKPIVWTLHDMNPFMGGFHYHGDQQKNEASFKALDEQIRLVKKEAYSTNNNLTIVTPSRWMHQQASASILLKDFPIHHIPYGVDTSIFKMHDQTFARRVFNLPKDKRILLFISDSLSNERKGFDLLLKAFSKEIDDSLWICTVGNAQLAMEELSNITNLGRIADERLIALLYSACDVFVLPSREDNFPNVMLEATACGTPIIAFPIGGIPDIIQNGFNGILAEGNILSGESLHRAITQFTEQSFTFEREKIRNFTEQHYSLDQQASAYKKLYQQLLNHY